MRIVNPFLLYPSEWNIEDVEIVGTENVYRLFKREMANNSIKFEIKWNVEINLPGK